MGLPNDPMPEVEEQGNACMVGRFPASKSPSRSGTGGGILDDGITIRVGAWEGHDYPLLGWFQLLMARTREVNKNKLPVAAMGVLTLWRQLEHWTPRW